MNPGVRSGAVKCPGFGATSPLVTVTPAGARELFPAIGSRSRSESLSAPIIVCLGVDDILANRASVGEGSSLSPSSMSVRVPAAKPWTGHRR